MRPNVLRIEAGCIEHIAEALTHNHIGGKILYISDPVVDSLYGENVRRQIERVGSLKQETVSSNTISYAMDVAQKIIATDINCIVGMGGGRVLDVCKYAGYIAKIPFLSIPTTPSNDGIASPVAVLKRNDGKPKSLGCSIPTIILADINIIERAPIKLIKAGIGDAISNYMALQDWVLACERGKDEMNGYAYLISRSTLDSLMKTQYDSICKEFIEVLVNSLVLSGIAMDFAGSSRPVSGSEHLFSHALDYYGKTNNLHGIQVALGTIAVLKLIGRDYSAVLDYLRRFGVDINPVHMDIDEHTFVRCMQCATKMRENRYTYLNEADLGEGKLSHIYYELVEEL